jgi:hypothetical protein
MAKRNQQRLFAGRVLTVTADSNSNGTVRRMSNSTDYQPETVAASATLTYGPYSLDRDFEILSDRGTLGYSFSQADTDVDSMPVTEMDADGAIRIATGLVVFTKSASAIAATLAAPTAAQAGTFMRFTAGTAKAHVITATGLIQDGVTGGGKDTATLAAFIGSSVTLVAWNLKWHVLSLNVCTIA